MSQLLLFEPSRLAHRPYCTDDLEAGLSIRGQDVALTRKYIQANCPALQFRLVLDVDHDIRSTAELHRWSDDYNAPQPNWSAITPKTGRGHVGYEIEVPIAKHDHARSAPLRLAAAIEDGLARKLQADFGYAGLICKNPTHSAWRTVPGRVQPYDLTELSEWVNLAEYTGKRPGSRKARWAAIACCLTACASGHTPVCANTRERHPLKPGTRPWNARPWSSTTSIKPTWCAKTR